MVSDDIEVIHKVASLLMRKQRKFAQSKEFIVRFMQTCGLQLMMPKTRDMLLRLRLSPLMSMH